MENFLSTKAEHEFNLVTSDLVTPLQDMSICFPRDTYNAVVAGSANGDKTWREAIAQPRGGR